MEDPGASSSTITIGRPQWRHTKVGGFESGASFAAASPTITAWRRRAPRATPRRSEVEPAVAVGQQLVMPDAVEAAGQHVQQEAAHELIGAEVMAL
jgi:hypothetical protein